MFFEKLFFFVFLGENLRFYMDHRYFLTPMKSEPRPYVVRSALVVRTSIVNASEQVLLRAAAIVRGRSERN